jgi:DNA-binding transcriptional LysR family regulator
VLALDPKHCAAFLAAAHSGSLRGAAEALGLEPSTLSRNIAALEKQLGTPLLERHSKGILLTEAGGLLQDYLRRQSSELELMQSQFDALRGMQRGTIALAVGEGFVSDLFNNALKSFSETYPRLTYTLTVGATDSVAHLVKTDQAHLGLAYNPDPDPQIKPLASANRPLVLLAARTSPYADLPDPVPLALAATLPCALLHSGSGVGAMLRLAESREGLRLPALVETHSIAVLKAFVHSGMGVTYLPRFVVTAEIAGGAILAKPLQNNGFGQGQAQLFARNGRHLPQAAQKLARHLARCMSAFTS